MNICIFGAGAIGGYLAVMLARAGATVSVVARGPQLAAIRRQGLALDMDGERFIVHPQASDHPAELGPQDYVIVALKAHAAPKAVDALTALLHDRTAVVTAVNGVPWWYFYGLKGRYENHRIHAVDPDNRQWDRIGPERAIGCVVYPACEISEPGVIRHISGNRFTLGEASGEKTERVRALSDLMINAGLKAPVRNIRDEIWVKLWGNLCFNPLSALTHATLDVLATDPGTRNIARRMMLEARTIGAKLGVRFTIDVDQRLDGAAAVGAHATSMLQDLQLGRPLEIDALVTAVQELGRITDTPTPTIDLVLPIVQQRARIAGCYT